MVKITKNDDNDHGRLSVVIISYPNNDNVKTSSKYNVGIANDVSWSLIMPYLGLYMLLIASMTIVESDPICQSLLKT